MAAEEAVVDLVEAAVSSGQLISSFIANVCKGGFGGGYGRGGGYGGGQGGYGGGGYGL